MRGDTTCILVCTVSETRNDTIDSGNQILKVSNTIISTSQISGTANVQYFAEKSILLEPGFQSTSIAGGLFIAQIQECANCSDGIQNGDETGVDCGGSICAPCPTNVLAASTNIHYKAVKSTSLQSELSENPDSPYILVYPNPTQGELRVQIQTARPQSVQLSIQNALGRNIFQSKSELSHSIFQTSLDVSDYPAGSYWLRIWFVEDGEWEVVGFVRQ